MLPDGADPAVRAIDETTLTGPIAAMLEDASAFIARNSRRRLIADQATGQVRDVLDPPAVAVRELFSNALVHRDLAEWSASRAIECRMDPSAFRVTNPGGLYGVTTERLGVHPLTSARNRRLLEICKFIRTADGNVVEALASGIPAALRATRDAGLPGIAFYDQAITFTATVRRTPDTPTKPAATRSSSPRDDLLRLLDTAKSLADIAASLGISENAARKRLRPLRDAGLVVQHGGPGRPTTYEQRR